MGENKKMTEITIHAESEEEAHQLVSTLFNQDKSQNATGKKSPSVLKSVFSKIGDVFFILISWLLKLVVFILRVPLFIISLIRNLIGSAILVFIIYFIGALAYYNFSGQYERVGNGDAINAILFTDSKITILVTIVVILALIATFGEMLGDRE